jgi:anion-transporting  ArsA/GET3 family ATPase
MHTSRLCTRITAQTVPRAVLAALVRALQEQSASPEEEALQQEAALLVPQLLAVLLTARPELQPLAADTNAVTDLCQQYISQSSVQAHQKASISSCNSGRSVHLCSLPRRLQDLRSCQRKKQHADNQESIIVRHLFGFY